MGSNITSGISMNADLLRQRRNLIGISAVLLVFDFANVEIAKVSVLGTELLVGNVRVLAICAWVIWFYFLVRYYQYLHAEPDRHIRNSFTERFVRYVRSFTKVSDQDEVGQPLSYRIRRVGFAKWSYVSRPYDPARGEFVDGVGPHLPWWRLVVWSVKTAAFVGIQTPHATDRILPFALAIAAPVVTLYTKWPLL